MNILAVILIIVDVEGYPNIIGMPGKAHPIVGFATLFCIVLNVSTNVTESLNVNWFKGKLKYITSHWQKDTYTDNI